MVDDGTNAHTLVRTNEKFSDYTVLPVVNPRPATRDPHKDLDSILQIYYQSQLYRRHKRTKTKTDAIQF
jgi:hypothetical protein